MKSIKKFSKHYSDASLWEKLGRLSKKAGAKAVYPALLLYYLLKDKNAPLSTKAYVIGALGYFIFPFDLLPDTFLPLGLSDDVSILLFVLDQVQNHITPEIRQKADETRDRWFENETAVVIHVDEQED